MAKKTAALSTAGAQSTVAAAAAAVRQSYNGDFTGTFNGDFTGTFNGNLKGKADTATALESPFRVDMTGDVTGSFATSGRNTVARVQVNRAKEANHALYADAAGTVDHAQTAATATYATNAGNAVNASKAASAGTAERADFATNAGHAKTADEALTATTATKATKADHATNADEALKAKEAEKAKFADALTDTSVPVPKADWAKTAHIAEIAKYDCLGRSFPDYYALKTDLPEHFFTIEEAKDLFVPRCEQVLQATVCGKAFGHGFLEGNTLKILITSLALDGDKENIYGSIEFVDQFVEKLADTTKIYVDKEGQKYGHMFVFDQEINDFGAPGLGHWVEITSRLDDETQEALDNALAKINDVVTIHNDQVIKDHKTFENTVKAEIADLENDDPRTVVTVHNLRDVMDRLTTMIEAAVGTGWEWALIDYTLAENQVGMPEHKSYWGLRAEDKSYIAINPETGQPFDSTAVVKYIRHFRKGSNGAVVYFDVEVTDHSVYARLDGATFTGPVHVPSINLDEEPSDLAINFRDVHHLIKDMIEEAQVGKIWMFLGERPTTTEEIPAERIGLYEVYPKPVEEDFAWTYVGDRPTEATLPSLNIHDVLLYNTEPVVLEEDSAWTYIGDRPTDAAGLSIKDVLLYNAEINEVGKYDITSGRLYDEDPGAVAIDNHQIVLIQKDFDPIGDVEDPVEGNAILKGSIYTEYPQPLDVDNHEVVLVQDKDKLLIKD